jgi:hypothetical protein
MLVLFFIEHLQVPYGLAFGKDEIVALTYFHVAEMKSYLTVGAVSLLIWDGARLEGKLKAAVNTETVCHWSLYGVVRIWRLLAPVMSALLAIPSLLTGRAASLQ